MIYIDYLHVDMVEYCYNVHFGGEIMGDANVENWVKLRDVQSYLGVRRETILAWISKRNMPAYKVGRLWKFKLSEIDDWIRSGGADERKSTKDDE